MSGRKRPSPGPPAIEQPRRVVKGFKVDLIGQKCCRLYHTVEANGEERWLQQGQFSFYEQSEGCLNAFHEQIGDKLEIAVTECYRITNMVKAGKAEAEIQNSVILANRLRSNRAEPAAPPARRGARRPAAPSGNGTASKKKREEEEVPEDPAQEKKEDSEDSEEESEEDEEDSELEDEDDGDAPEQNGDAPPPPPQGPEESDGSDNNNDDEEHPAGSAQNGSALPRVNALSLSE